MHTQSLISCGDGTRSVKHKTKYKHIAHLTLRSDILKTTSIQGNVYYYVKALS